MGEPGLPRRLGGLDVAAEVHQGLDCFGHEGGRLRASAKVYGPAVEGSASPGGVDLRLDDAGVAVVDGAEDGDRAAVATCVPDEQLAAGASARRRSLRAGGVRGSLRDGLLVGEAADSDEEVVRALA